MIGIDKHYLLLLLNKHNGRVLTATKKIVYLTKESRLLKLKNHHRQNLPG